MKGKAINVSGNVLEKQIGEYFNNAGIAKIFLIKPNNWKVQTTKERITMLNYIQVRTDFPLPGRTGYFS